MPFPDTPRVVYSRRVLTEVICQLRYPPILRIGEGQLAEFQELVRDEYPLYSEQVPSISAPGLPPELGPFLKQMEFIGRGGLTTFRMATKDSSRFLVLAQEFLALTDYHYERWERFSNQMKEAERALMNVYRPSFYTRVGLRYKNLISRERVGLAGVPWSELLLPHMLAELGAAGVSDAVESSTTTTVLKLTEVDNGRVRLIHGVQRDNESGEQCYLIDADLWLENKEGIDVPFAILDKLNRLAGRLFRWSVTERLHRAMEPRNP